jgi:rhodanese-related sulfurtransferase
MFFFQSSTDCSAQDVKNAQSDPNAVIVDCRTHSEASAGSVKGAHVKDWLGGELHQAISSWDKSKKYYLFCRSGNRSGQATKFMRSHGFENVYNAGSISNLAGL